MTFFFFLMSRLSSFQGRPYVDGITRMSLLVLVLREHSGESQLDGRQGGPSPVEPTLCIPVVL
jgi:hypothetical protein